MALAVEVATLVVVESAVVVVELWVVVVELEVVAVELLVSTIELATFVVEPSATTVESTVFVIEPSAVAVESTARVGVGPAALAAAVGTVPKTVATRRTAASVGVKSGERDTRTVRPGFGLKPSGTGGFLLDRFAGVNMVDLVLALELAGNAVGALGAALVFFEFFQLPSYVEYSEEYNDYSVDISPMEVTEHTWIGRIGAFLLIVAFTAQFVAALLA